MAGNFNLDDYPKILITNKGNKILVDQENFNILRKYTWFEDPIGYAITEIYIGSRRNVISMQRMIMNPPRDTQIDHINHNPLDNRESNLRIVSRSQNCMNQKLKSNNKSGHKGVIYHKSSDKWMAYITINQKRIYLGLFEKREDAIKSREEAENKYFGEFNYKEMY